ncbi:hypothetical protein LI216_10320 [Mediterraneibacter glycyrrhizinilyticus]|uniref:hypothetical protein n=1 Tax=Mediterraneibacter glycyrrhizinilyticus TaxID=342942 RepID=UPI001D08A11B|nr:hypothetical protein [Mediterraneibacter glycyrrhizinilyticus]MCB6310106.1 hypothetical protein [Lachnospiraceae bacterium 210521-DFI.1.109]MCB6427466.1 hypothetical protein [Mediterraneibacter glycyrrhizinilyticus]
MAFKPLTVNTPIGKKAHILVEDDAALYDGIFGEDCVLKLGEQFASKTISNNVIRVMDGVVVVGGHVGRIIKGDYEDMMIDNGTADQKRNDLIVARFQSGGTGGADTYSLVVVKGTPGSTAKDPAIVQEDLYAGGKRRDYPLYRVRIENLSVVGVDKLFKVNRNFKVLVEELDKTREKIDSVNQTLEERTNGKVKIYGDAEGGNIRITSPNGVIWEIDAYNDNLRAYCDDGSISYSFSKDGTLNIADLVISSVRTRLSEFIGKIKNAAYCTVVNNATTTGAGTVLDGRMGKTLNDKAGAAQNTANTAQETADAAKSMANTITVNLQNSPIGIGSAYGVTATAYSSMYVESVYFNGTNVGDSLAAYTQRNFGTLPAGHRPKTKVQVPVPAIDGLYFTIDTNGVVSMRNEKSTTISFGKCAMHGVITFVK